MAGTQTCLLVLDHFHSRTVHLDIIKALLPTDAQENYFKSTITIYFKAQAQIVRSLMMVIIPKHVGGILM
jgi:hypothetical protein